MSQNINLLTELDIHPPVILNSKMMAGVFIGWMALLFFIYLITYFVSLNKQQELSGLEATKKYLSSNIEAYQRAFPGLQVEKSSSSISEELKSVGGPGFYSYLEDLANLIPPGIWINEMIISEQDNVVTFKGSSILASGAPTLIYALSKSNSFRNKKFNTINLQENLETHNTDFMISTANPILTKLKKE